MYSLWISSMELLKTKKVHKNNHSLMWANLTKGPRVLNLETQNALNLIANEGFFAKNPEVSFTKKLGTCGDTKEPKTRTDRQWKCIFNLVFSSVKLDASEKLRAGNPTTFDKLGRTCTCNCQWATMPLKHSFVNKTVCSERLGKAGYIHTL